MLRSLVSGEPVYDSAHVIPKFDQTVCITGHRGKSVIPYGGLDEYRDITMKTVKLMLCRYIDMAVSAGYTTFLSGLAMGTDLWAADYILRIRQKDERIKLIGAMPFLRHADRFPFAYRKLLERVEHGADILISTCMDPDMVYGKKRSETTSPELYRERNYLMVERSAAVLAFFEPSESHSGTAQTINQAARLGRLIRSFGLSEVYSVIERSGNDLRAAATEISFLENVFAR
ncbi:MAG: DUF1273 family protein [Ruminococcus sp.]|nr:DUF1273 family protein [Ruminococcus sp.]